MSNVEQQIVASKALVKHLVKRCLESPDFAYWCGYGTQTRDYLVAAAGALFEIAPAEIQRKLREDYEFGDRKPVHVDAEQRRDELERRVEELERKVRALGGEP